MNDREQRRSVEDDSLLASVAGVPLTRSARIGACLIWAAFWCARLLLTDALLYINAGQLRPALLQLLGENAFDQAFSIGMVWLTVEVVVVIWNTLKTVAIMLIAKKGKPLIHVFVDNLSDENLELVAARVNQRLQSRKQAASGKKERDNNGGK